MSLPRVLPRRSPRLRRRPNFGILRSGRQASDAAREAPSRPLLPTLPRQRWRPMAVGWEHRVAAVAAATLLRRHILPLPLMQATLLPLTGLLPCPTRPLRNVDCLTMATLADPGARTARLRSRVMRPLRR